MNINQYLQLHKDIIRGKTYSYRRTAPRVVCKDGFNISIQVSSSHYCSPREDDSDFYYEMEMGYPNQHLPPIYKTWAEDRDAPMENGFVDTVWAYVPVGLVDTLLLLHGGIAGPLVRRGEEEE